MQTHLSPEFADTPEGEEAQAIIRKCVHCGFCNATCPTYQLLGDELDGPRGRIYLMKQVLEGRVRLPSEVAPDVPPVLDAIVLRGLHREPAARFPTAKEMALALEEAPA